VPDPEPGTLPDGPSSVEGLFAWNLVASQCLFGDLDAATRKATLQKLANYHIIVTSEFSGMGTGELAVHLAIEGIRKQSAGNGGQISRP